MVDCNGRSTHRLAVGLPEIVRGFAVCQFCQREIAIDGDQKAAAAQQIQETIERHDLVLKQTAANVVELVDIVKNMSGRGR